MALIIKDRVQETSTTSGTGTITLGGAVTGYQSFASAIGSGNTTYYAIYETQTTNWEVGIGTVGSGTLARTTVLASSNAGSLVSFGGAQLAVYGDMPAAKGLYTDYVGTVSGLSIGGNAATATTSTNLTGGSNNAIPYQSTSGATSFLPYGTSGNVLVTLGNFSAPTWSAPSSLNVGSAANIDGGAAGEIPFQTGANTTSFTAAGTAGQVLTSQGTGTPTWTTPTTGTVTSVTGTSPVASSGGATPAISLSSGYGDTQNPYASKTANYFLAAPNGSSGTPSFRAVVAADIPTLNQNTTGNAATATSATTATNLASGSANQIAYQTSSGTTAFITAPTTSSTFLEWNGSAFTWASAGGGLVNSVTGTAPINVTTLLGVANVSLASGYGDTQNPYASKTANYIYAAPNGSSGVPTFRAMVASDVPTLNQNTTGTAGGLSGTPNISVGTVTASTYAATGSITGSSQTGAYSYGTLPSLSADVNIFASYTSSVNNYNQMILSNTNTGSSASTDYVVNNNNSTATTYYGDYGMNSSGWTGTAGTASFNAPNMVYLTSTTADLAIGTTTSNAIRFVTNSGADNATVSSSGAWTFANNVTGNGNFTATSSGPFFMNATTVSANTTIPTGYNAVTAGKITINTGVTVTVSTGSRWVVV